MFFLKNDLFSARNALHEAPELSESLSRSAERHQKTIGQVSLGHVENIQQLPKIHELKAFFYVFVFGCDDHRLECRLEETHGIAAVSLNPG